MGLQNELIQNWLTHKLIRLRCRCVEMEMYILDGCRDGLRLTVADLSGMITG